MSGTVSSTYASAIAAAQASATANAATSSSSSSSSSSGTGGNGTTTLTALAGNFNDFLTLLTTQLQNQDPTAPMDTNQFTSQLVQFTGVAEQIQTNSTLTSLLSAAQTQQLGQASSLVGAQVSISGGTLPLQNSTAQVNFTTATAEPVQIAVVNSSGATVATQTVDSVAGSNTWTWNGLNSNGTQLADGAYTVAVMSGSTAVPFQSVGTVTGAEQLNGAIQLEFGTATAPYSQVTAIAASGTSSSGS